MPREKAPASELSIAVAKAVQALGLTAADEDKKTKMAEVVRSGSKITIPEDMTLEEAGRVIEAKMEDEETRIAMQETFDVFVWEGAYAMAKTLDENYGWFQQIKTPGSFFEPDRKPAMIAVKIGPDETIQVPWGRFLLPNIPPGDGWLSTGFNAIPGEIVKFQLTAELKKKHSRQFHQLCAAIRKQLLTTSLYKGKGITVKFHDNEGNRLPWPEPDFARISTMKAENLIFSRHIEDALKVNLLTPIKQTQQCRDHDIPLKRGVALAGTFGTGKTLIATLIATLAPENGWTYVHCTQTADFPDCVKFAQRYQPAVVFCEDIDKSTSGDRDAEMDRVLNTIDGVDSKNTEIILVVTTNEVEEINQAMLRPGRFDAVIHMERPDAEAVTRLLRYYAGALLAADEPLEEIGRLLAGSTPAVIREVVERSKLAAIGELAPGADMKLSENALRISAETMRMHRSLMDKTVKTELSDMETFGNVVGMFLQRGIEGLAETQSAKRLAEAAGSVTAHDALTNAAAAGR